MSDAPAPVTPTVAAELLDRALGSEDPAVAGWAASRTALDATDLAAALTASESAGHSTRDRVLDRIARAGASELGPQIRPLAEPKASCGVPVRTLLALKDPEGVKRAAEWLATRVAENAEDVGTVVQALLAEGSPEALAEARKVRDSRIYDQHAPLMLAFSVLATTGEDVDAEAALTAWIQTPPRMWQGEEPVCGWIAECGVAAVPAVWFAVGRRVPEFLKALDEATDAPMDGLGDAAARKELARHWQKRHLQEVVTRLRKATDLEALTAPLAALVRAIQSRGEALGRLDADDAGDLLAVALGAALVSHATAPDATTLDPAGLVAEFEQPRRRIDPRHTRALMDRASELGDDMLPVLTELLERSPGSPGAGLAIAALLRNESPQRLRSLWFASRLALPSSLLGGVLEALAGAGPDALPLLRDALSDPAKAPPVPTPGLMALIEGAPYGETAALLTPVLPRWLARSKQRTLALCAMLAHPDLLPALEADWLEGEHAVGGVIRLIASLHGDTATAERYPATQPERPGILRGPDGRPILPPMQLLLRCVDCDHGYYYAVRQVRITDQNAQFVEEEGPPGPPEGIAVGETITCKRCGAENRYRFTLEAVQAVRDAMEAEMMIAMQEQMRQQQQAAQQAMGGEQPGPPPGRRSAGGIILP